MTQSSFTLDVLNFSAPHGDELQISQICLTALEGLEAIFPNDASVMRAKDQAVEFLTELRLLCMKRRSDFGFETMK